MGNEKWCTPDLTPFGAALNLARLTAATAARSNAPLPDDRLILTDAKLPLLETATASMTLPRARVLAGYFLRRSIALRILPPQRDIAAGLEA